MKDTTWHQFYSQIFSEKDLSFFQKWLEKDQRKSLRINTKRIRRIVAENAHKIRTDSPDALQILIQESKRRKKKSARKLFTEIPDLLKSLKPCWAMSPLVVSQLLPANEPFFDVVIFDEASQIEPEGAITSLVRANKQLLQEIQNSYLQQKLLSFLKILMKILDMQKKVMNLLIMLPRQNPYLRQ